MGEDAAQQCKQTGNDCQNLQAYGISSMQILFRHFIHTLFLLRLNPPIMNNQQETCDGRDGPSHRSGTLVVAAACPHPVNQGKQYSKQNLHSDNFS
jgi:hypothetical protein